jgi:hypothetical protein
MSLPSIKFSIQCFVPRIARTYFQKRLNQQEAELPDFTIANNGVYFKELVNPANAESRVSIRINNYFSMVLKEFEEGKKMGYL